MKRYLVVATILITLAAALMACAPARADGFIHIVPPPWPHPRPAPRPVITPLSVKYHHVNVVIKEQLAVTSIDQEFRNPNNMQLEGIFMFPVPKGVTINTFSMYIDGKEQQAELLDAGKARRIYEDIVRKMKDPALLEYADRRVRLGRRRDEGDVLLPQAAMAPEEKEKAGAHYEAMASSVTGADAFDAAISLGGAKAVTRAQGPGNAFVYTKKDGSRTRLSDQMKTVGAKTFYFNETVWVDSVYQIEKPGKKVKVAYLSDEYFKLLDKDPLFGAYLAVGKNLIVCVGGTAYEITEQISPE